MSTPDILPECRAKVTRGVVPSSRGNQVPIFCANCGIDGGWVPEKYCTFAFYLCDPCAEKHGDPAHFYKEPNAVFFERVAAAQQDALGEGRYYSPLELLAQLEDPSSKMSKLADEWAKHVTKGS